MELCNATNSLYAPEGDLVYNSAYYGFQFCDGTN